MIETQIKEMISLLATEFKISEPFLVFTRSTTGSYLPRSNRIKVGMRSWREIENLILHEFAHALTDFRYGRIRRTPYGKTIWHGPEFTRCLIEIINAWYGDQAKYSWNTEYKSLQAYGPRK
jgi:hypothetical protein